MKEKTEKKALNIKEVAYGVIIAMPMVISVAWLFSILVMGQIAAESGLMLSPLKDNKPIVIGLIIFIIGYLVFLIVMYSDILKRIFSPAAKAKRH